MIANILTLILNKFKESIFRFENSPTPKIKRKSFQVTTLNSYQNIQILCDENDETFTIISLNKKHRIEINSVGFENLIEAIELSVFLPNAKSCLIVPMAFN